MSNILTMASGSTSPFRLLSPSADPLNPSLEDVIFDGNAQPLRIKQKGEIYVAQGPGYSSPRGAYGGASTPIVNPYPGKRHLCTALGWKADGIRLTPGQIGGLANTNLGAYWTDSGIGVGTDASNVWGLNNFASTPILGIIGYIPVCTSYYNGYCQSYSNQPVYGVVGFQQVAATISYIVFQNTVG